MTNHIRFSPAQRPPFNYGKKLWNMFLPTTGAVAMRADTPTQADRINCSKPLVPINTDHNRPTEYPRFPMIAKCHQPTQLDRLMIKFE
jgi:hypothetical protein